MKYLINKIIFFYLISVTLTCSLLAQKNINKHISTIGSDSVDSWLWGIYKNYPVLSREDLKESKLRLNEISRETDSLLIKKVSLHNELDYLFKEDTVKLKKHFTFFGGLFTIPALNEKEQNIKELHGRINEHMLTLRDLDKELKELKREKHKIFRLMKKNRKYRVVKMFWGFANWEVEKE